MPTRVRAWGVRVTGDPTEAHSLRAFGWIPCLELWATGESELLRVKKMLLPALRERKGAPHRGIPVQTTSSFHRRFVLLAADKTALRQPLSFKHDEEKVRRVPCCCFLGAQVSGGLDLGAFGDELGLADRQAGRQQDSGCGRPSLRPVHVYGVHPAQHGSGFVPHGAQALDQGDGALCPRRGTCLRD
jgi:hypothetical protein